MNPLREYIVTGGGQCGQCAGWERPYNKPITCPHEPPMPAAIDDTYAEAFRSIYAGVLITARDRYWLDRAVQAATGNASSTILCDCEAGLDRYLEPAETPDQRPGAIVQFHVP